MTTRIITVKKEDRVIKIEEIRVITVEKEDRRIKVYAKKGVN